MSEFELDGHQYRIAKLNTIQQWHLNRRIAPLIPPLVPVFIQISKAGKIKDDVAGIAALMGPFADGIASMSDEASEFVLNTCLSAVSRQVGDGKWMKIWNAQAKISTFEEFNDLGKALPMVMKVIWEALGPFINGLLTAQEPEQTAESAP